LLLLEPNYCCCCCCFCWAKEKAMCASESAAPQSYAVLATGVKAGEAVIFGLNRCQDALAQHHEELYLSSYPALNSHRWLSLLCCGRLREYIQHGIIVLRAVEISTGEVVGYLSYSRAPADPEKGSHAFAKINHLVVLPEHRGQGVGAQLFKVFSQHMEARPLMGSSAAQAAIDDVRIIAAELNKDAIAWYRRLGFVVGHLHVTCHDEGRVCYVAMRRCTGIGRVEGEAQAPPNRLFGPEVCNERVTLAPEQGAMQLVQGYDSESGLHLLAGGSWVDLTAAFVEGRLEFERPLHDIISPTAKPGPSAAGALHGLGDNEKQSQQGQDARPSLSPDKADKADELLGADREEEEEEEERDERDFRRMTRSLTKAQRGIDETKNQQPEQPQHFSKPSRAKRKNTTSPEAPEESDEESWERAPCRACGEVKNPGSTLLCDGQSGNCNATYHYYCVGLKCVPKGDWLCPDCTARPAADVTPEKHIRQPMPVDAESPMSGSGEPASENGTRRVKRRLMLV